jgi:hypothetical protein
MGIARVSDGCCANIGAGARHAQSSAMVVLAFARVSNAERIA